MQLLNQTFQLITKILNWMSKLKTSWKARSMETSLWTLVTGQCVTMSVEVDSRRNLLGALHLLEGSSVRENYSNAHATLLLVRKEKTQLNLKMMTGSTNSQPSLCLSNLTHAKCHTDSSSKKSVT